MRGRIDLKRLPRVGASPGFTDDVLRRARRLEPSAVRLTGSRRPLAVAAAAVVVLSAAAGAWWARQSAPPPITAEGIEQMRSEHRALIRELDELLRLGEDTQPFVPVSVNPQTDVLFDLRDLEPLSIRFASAGSPPCPSASGTTRTSSTTRTGVRP